jgi:hypothetical protein
MSLHLTDNTHDSRTARHAYGCALDPLVSLEHARQRLAQRMQHLRNHHPLNVLLLSADGGRRDLTSLKVHATRGTCQAIVADHDPAVMNVPPAPGFEHVHVPSDAHVQELMGRAAIVLIRTPPPLRPHQVRLALEMKAPLVLVESPPGDTIARCVGLADRIRRAFPQSLVFFTESGDERLLAGLFDPQAPSPPLQTIHESLDALRLVESKIGPGSRSTARRRYLPRRRRSLGWPSRLEPMNFSSTKDRPRSE